MANSSKLRSFPDRVGFVERIILARYMREEARRGKATRVFILDETGVEDRCSFDGRWESERREEGHEESCPVILFFPPAFQTSPLDTCVRRRHRYRRQAPLELRNCRCPAAYLDGPPLPNFQKQAGSWPQKGGWSFCGTLSKTCVERTQVAERSPTCEGKTDSSFPQESIRLE